MTKSDTRVLLIRQDQAGSGRFRQASRANDTVVTNETSTGNLPDTDFDIIIVEAALVGVNVATADHLTSGIVDTKLRCLTTQHTSLGQDGLTIGTTTLRKEYPRIIAADNGNQIRSNDLQVLQRVTLDIRPLPVLHTDFVDLGITLSNFSESRVSDKHKSFRHISRMSVTNRSKRLEARCHNRIKRQRINAVRNIKITTNVLGNSGELSLRLVRIIKDISTKSLLRRVKELQQDQKVLSTRSDSSSILREAANNVPLIVNERFEAELDASTVLSGGNKSTIRLIAHGGVRRQLRHMRQSAHRVLVATIVDRGRGAIRLQRQKRGGAEIRQQLLRRDLVPNRLMSIVILLKTNVCGLHKHGGQLVRGDSLLQARLRETITLKSFSQLVIEISLVLKTHVKDSLSGVLRRCENDLHLLRVGRSSKWLLQPTDNNISTDLNGRDLRLHTCASCSLRVHRSASLSSGNRLAGQLKHTPSDTHRGVTLAIQAVRRSDQDIPNSRCRTTFSRRVNLRLKNTCDAVVLVDNNDIPRLKMSLRGINREGESLRVLKDLVVVDNRNLNRHDCHGSHQPIFPKDSFKETSADLSSTGVAVAATASLRYARSASRADSTSTPFFTASRTRTTAASGSPDSAIFLPASIAASTSTDASSTFSSSLDS
nr:MAG TPA: hypothetical protein [Caudoviricetes sp.]